jgi:hypothetical protein
MNNSAHCDFASDKEAFDLSSLLDIKQKAAGKGVYRETKKESVVRHENEVSLMCLSCDRGEDATTPSEMHCASVARSVYRFIGSGRVTIPNEKL